MKESKNEFPMKRSSLLGASSGPFASPHFKRLKDNFRRSLLLSMLHREAVDRYERCFLPFGHLV